MDNNNQNHSHNTITSQPTQQQLNSNATSNFNPMIVQPTQNNDNKNSKYGKMIIAAIAAVAVVILCIFGYNAIIESTGSLDSMNSANSAESNPPISDTEQIEKDKTGAFLMPIEDAFVITGRGVVVTGKVERGIVKLNDRVQIIGLDKESVVATVSDMEKFREHLSQAEAGTIVGILLEGIERKDVERGQVLAEPDSIKAATKFEADVYILTKREGGRSMPFYADYKPQFYFRTTAIDGTIELPEGVEKVNPGDNTKITVELVTDVAMEVGTEFSIRENNKTTGKGTITKVY